jgi:hypothetical protein
MDIKVYIVSALIQDTGQTQNIGYRVWVTPDLAISFQVSIGITNQDTAVGV